MKFGVVVFPGSNCDQDMYHVLKNVMGQDTVKLWHKSRDLEGCHFIVLPGGFSYGDYLRCGAIARFSPIMESVLQHASRGGYVLGVCNGFQILTEAQLVPGALLRNAGQKFICRNQYIKPATSNSIMTANLNLNKAYKIPIAHAEGRYFANEDTLKMLQDNDQVLFYYSNEAAQVGAQYNPNQSSLHIAGVMNKGRNVFGMMPHPERAADTMLNNTDGRAIFESILQHVVQIA
ncbi:MAG: phosphoribosylformylglycinamidine synthase subunit PurQ [Cytophagales bacterium]|nr:MAG: phosphoribosylformylglycinamidine synthase subunit PurQ [Cytophagales bacterium]